VLAVQRRGSYWQRFARDRDLSLAAATVLEPDGKATAFPVTAAAD